MANTRAKTVTREHAYEVRLIDGQPAYALKFYQAQTSPNPYARVKVSYGDDIVGHDMYVWKFEQYPSISNPLLPEPVVVDADPEPWYTQLPAEQLIEVKFQQ